MSLSPAKETRAGRGDLVPRIVSSVVLILIAILGAWWGGLATAIVVGALAIIVRLGWTTITEGRPWVAAVFTISVAAAMVVAGTGRMDWAVGMAGVIALSAAAVGPRPWRAAGIVYVAALGLSLLSLRASADGLAAVGLLFAVVWATDVGAFFAGRTFGGPRLWPAVSPKKTWAGAVGGLLAGAAAGSATVVALGGEFKPLVIGVTMILSIASQCGDLFESYVKRRFGVKDSGTIIPGHGGMMDRVDGLVFAAPVAVFIGFLHSGGSNPGRGLILW